MRSPLYNTLYVVNIKHCILVVVCCSYDVFYTCSSDFLTVYALNHKMKNTTKHEKTRQNHDGLSRIQPSHHKQAVFKKNETRRNTTKHDGYTMRFACCDFDGLNDYYINKLAHQNLNTQIATCICRVSSCFVVFRFSKKVRFL